MSKSRLVNQIDAEIQRGINRRQIEAGGRRRKSAIATLAYNSPQEQDKE